MSIRSPSVQHPQFHHMFFAFPNWSFFITTRMSRCWWESRRYDLLVVAWSCECITSSWSGRVSIISTSEDKRIIKKTQQTKSLYLENKLLTRRSLQRRSMFSRLYPSPLPSLPVKRSANAWNGIDEHTSSANHVHTYLVLSPNIMFHNIQFVPWSSILT